MSEKVVLIIQARMGSVRLPGKSLMGLAGETLVGRVLGRVKKCRSVDEIVLAVPNTKQNDELAKLADHYEVSLYRGAENDLVDRYYQAACLSEAAIVGRLPADNPVPEPSEIDRIVDFHISSGFDFTSNLSEVFCNGYPDGVGAEMITFAALEEVWKERVDFQKKEHVHMNFFDYSTQQQVDARFSVGTVECPSEFRRPDLVLDVNTIEQYIFIKELYEYFCYDKGNIDFHITDIVWWYDEIYMKGK